MMRQPTLDQLVEAAGQQVRHVVTARRGDGQSDAYIGGDDGIVEAKTAEDEEMVDPRGISCESMDVERDEYDNDPNGYAEELEGYSDGDGGEEAAAGAAAADGAVSVYSFGRGDLGALLQADDVDHGAEEGPVTLREHWSVLQVSYREGGEGRSIVVLILCCGCATRLSWGSWAWRQEIKRGWELGWFKRRGKRLDPSGIAARRLQAP